MAELNKQDLSAGLVPARVGRHRVTAYDPETLLRVLERIAGGELLIDLEHEPGFPRRLTVMQWIMADGAAARAFAAAIELSAMAMEEKAIRMGKDIAADPGSGTKVRAYEVAMNQLRWSASRRNPKKFGEQRQTQIVVPVTINTSLPMGEASVGTGTEDHPNIYQIEAKVTVQDEEQGIEEVAMQDLDEPLFPPHANAHDPRKQVLVPAEQSVPRAVLDERVQRKAEQEERKKAGDRERLRKIKDEVRATGKKPGDMSYREMKQWLQDHPKLTP